MKSSLVGTDMLIGILCVHEVSMRRPIKHILDDFVFREAGAAIRTISLVRGVTAADPYAAAQSQVNAGSAVVRSIDMMLEVYVDNGGVASSAPYDYMDWYVWFNVAGAQTKPDPNQAGISDLKNQIWHQDHAVVGVGSTAAVTTTVPEQSFAKWHVRINVPTWAQKINKDDEIQLIYKWNFAEATHDLKLKAIFMEYEQS